MKICELTFEELNNVTGGMKNCQTGAWKAVMDGVDTALMNCAPTTHYHPDVPNGGGIPTPWP
jgi:bacteriocin-like protein